MSLSYDLPLPANLFPACMAPPPFATGYVEGEYPLVARVEVGQVLSGEVERGTIENLLAMPATPLEIMLGKVVPFLAVSAVQVVVVLAADKALFAIPFAGSLSLLLTGVFVLPLVILGYLI